jgi:hypothetical protein
MTSLERLADAGQPHPTLTPDAAIAVLVKSTIAQRDGYAKDGQVLEGNVALAVWTSAEVGLPLVRALDWVYIVKGSANLTAAAQRVLARRAGYDLDFPDDEQTDTVGTAYIRYGTSGVWRKVTFTLEQARTANLLGKDNWQHYARDMLTARACTRAVSRYAEEVKAGMNASGVWPNDDDPDDIDGGRIAPSGATIPAAEREPAIDAEQLEAIVADLKALPADQREWFRRRWKDAPPTGLGCPSLTRGGWLTAAHGALARYMLADAEQAATFAARLAEAVADAVPPDVHDDAPEANQHEDGTERYDPDDADSGAPSS